MNAFRGLALAALLTLLLPFSALAQTLDERVRAISRQLMCPICEGRTVAESPSELAEQMRALIREKLKQGETPQGIIRYFVGRYGESILAVPPKRGLNLIVWVGPLALLLLATTIAVSTLRRWTRPDHQRPAAS